MAGAYQRAHEFALYFPNSTQHAVLKELVITDKELAHRIDRVLRLKQGESFVLFDRDSNLHVRIDAIERKTVTLSILSSEKNKRYVPHITYLLPLLKKDALSDAIYYLVETGVNEIRLIAADNQHRSWAKERDMDRLKRVAVAAAEQSKYFAFPEIHAPVSYNEALSVLPSDALRIYAHPDGQACKEIVSGQIPDHIVLTSGPEADLSPEEKEQLERASFHSMRLTPTILRAETAALCISSLFRTFFTNHI